MTVDSIRDPASPSGQTPDPLQNLLPTTNVGFRQSQREITRMGWLKVIVPTLAVISLVALVMWPVLNSAEGSFTLAMDRLEERDENAKLVKPRVVAIDKYGHPVNISAETAFRKSNDDKDYYLKNLLAQLSMQNGTGIKILATSGMYNAEAQQINLDGAVELTTENDFTLSTNQATFLINDKIASGNAGVKGTSPFGEFSADKFHVDVNREIIRLKGNVQHHYDPDQLTPKSPAAAPETVSDPVPAPEPANDTP